MNQSHFYNHINNSSLDRFTIIMAGGSGTRMGSNVPKQLHKVGNKPMMMHLIDNAHQIGTNIVLIISTKNKNIILNTLTSEKYITHVTDNDYCYKGTNIHICEQPIANGTGGALMSTSDFLSTKNKSDVLLVLSADVPLISKQTMLNMFKKGEHPLTECVLLTKDTSDNFGYGRIITDDNGDFIKIVEQKDCNDNEKIVSLINTGTYAFKVGSLMASFKYLNSNNAQNEYYLTDCPKYIKNVANIDNINPIKLVTLTDNDIKIYDETIGANTPEQLSYLRSEYLKKFSIEKIEKSAINMTDLNLRNLMKVLEQLSSSSVDIDNMDVERIRNHIRDINQSVINKKHLFVVRYEDTIVGTGSILVENKLIRNIGKASHIEDIVIDDAYRGLGLAKRLMLDLIQCSKDEGCYKIILDASDDVKVFYEKLGFYQHANSMRLNV
jgi:bifunctional N-acetylglucosamine-1-phosphate-uridyltransferase/glucosamine-1-phosphate-acetyltransferase GlmU-like protein